MRSISRRLALPFAVLMLFAFAGTAFAADKYVALGDSYSSGTGTRSYIDSTCQRSIYAYPYLVAQARPNTSLTFVRCSGAKTGDVLSKQVSSVTSDDELRHDHDRRQRRRVLERHHAVRAAVAVVLRQRHHQCAELHPQHVAGPARQRLQRDPQPLRRPPR